MLDTGEIVHVDKEITKKSDSEEDSLLLTKITSGKEYCESRGMRQEIQRQVLCFGGDRGSQAGTRESGLRCPAVCRMEEGKALVKLCWCPGTPVACRHKLSGLTRWRVTVSRFLRPRVLKPVSGTKWRCEYRRPDCLHWHGGEPVSCLFQLLVMSSIPWLVVTSLESFLFLKYLFIYLTALGFSCGTWDLAP